MKHARIRSPRILPLSLALAGSLLGAACADTTAPEQDEEIASTEQAIEQRFDGETLLQGVFFGRGPVAALLPEIWSKSPVGKDQAVEAFRSGMVQFERDQQNVRYDERVLQQLIESDSRAERAADEVSKIAIARLAERDPDFLKHFERGFYSGDPVIVSGVIDEAAKRLAELLEIEVIENPGGRYGSDWFVNENVAINVNAALNVNVAVNIDTAYNMVQFWSKGLDRASQLRNQVMIARLAQRFAG